MGWNRGYSIYEEQVVNAYDTGQLTPELLKIIISPFQDTDIDHGSCKDLRTKDGLSADYVVIKLLNPELWAKFEPYKDDWDHPMQQEVTKEWFEIMGAC